MKHFRQFRQGTQHVAKASDRREGGMLEGSKNQSETGVQTMSGE